jgi:K+-sensing histidine kinase KdpD
VPIEVSRRLGKSHIKIAKDGVRFLLIIFKVGTLYSPLKVYFPAAVFTSGLGVVNYVLTVMSAGYRFTNGTTLLLLTGAIMFLIGLLSEQLTNLQFKDTSNAGDRRAG